MERSRALLMAAALLFMAGCTTPADPGTTPSPTSHPTPPVTTAPPPVTTAPLETVQPPPGKMTVAGFVVDAALHPLPTANVTLLEAKETQHVDANGRFAFKDLDPGIYNLVARAPGYQDRTISVTPNTATRDIRFLLDARSSDTPYNVTVRVHGILQCAFEAAIISPSCDSAITFAGGPPVFDSNSTFPLPVSDGWKTVVTDVEFNAEGHAGLDGLRVTVAGTSQQGEAGIYEQYGRFNASTPFTFRIEPGAMYPEGTAPVPSNTTALRFEVFPHSHAWHAACAPPTGIPGAPEDEQCFLGAGAGVDVEFDLYMTVFYGQPAPQGFTLRTA